jgi:hypothetical protein
MDVNWDSYIDQMLIHEPGNQLEEEEEIEKVQCRNCGEVTSGQEFCSDICKKEVEAIEDKAEENFYERELYYAKLHNQMEYRSKNL